MFSLKVLSKLKLPDGRIFLEGETANGLTRPEVLSLVRDHPDAFEAADEATEKLLEEEA